MRQLEADFASVPPMGFSLSSKDHCVWYVWSRWRSNCIQREWKNNPTNRLFAYFIAEWSWKQEIKHFAVLSQCNLLCLSLQSIRRFFDCCIMLKHRSRSITEVLLLILILKMKKKIYIYISTILKHLVCSLAKRVPHAPGGLQIMPRK